MLRACFAVFAALTLIAPYASALSFSKLYVFGDSLVDVGNTQNLFGGTGSGDDPTPASDGNDDGRFTDGLDLADILNIAIEGVATGARRPPPTGPSPRAGSSRTTSTPRSFPSEQRRRRSGRASHLRREPDRAPSRGAPADEAVPCLPSGEVAEWLKALPC